VYVDIQRESWSGNRVTSKYFLRSLPDSRISFPSVYVCVRACVYAMPRAMDRRTGVLRQLFVSGGYAEHSKAPPEITGRSGAPASEIRTGNSHPSSELENVSRRKRKRRKK